MTIPTNQEKQAVWDAFKRGTPIRTPLRWNVNVRTSLLDPELNREGWTFEDYLHDPQVTLGSQARFQAYAARFYSQSSDRPDTLPERWSCSADVQNCYDPAFYGGKVHAPAGQVPAVEPFLTLDDVDEFLATDFCGDATRHFKTIRDAVGVGSFDTGFPVDHGWLRRELGPEVMINGGAHVGLLRSGTPEACYRGTERILKSGIRDGGKFILQEGNNLPPQCPVENLQAVYQACLDIGIVID